MHFNNYNSNMEVEIDNTKQLAYGLADMLNSRNIPNHTFQAVKSGSVYAVADCKPNSSLNYFWIKELKDNFLILRNIPQPVATEPSIRVTNLNDAANFVQNNL